jgi:hypothetical protein
MPREHGLAALEVLAEAAVRFADDAHHHLRGAVVAVQLLDCDSDLIVVLAEPLLLARMLHERPRRVRDQPGRGLVAGEEQQRARADELGRGERWLRVVPGRDERRDQVVLGCARSVRSAP